MRARGICVVLGLYRVAVPLELPSSVQARHAGGRRRHQRLREGRIRERRRRLIPILLFLHLSKQILESIFRSICPKPETSIPNFESSPASPSGLREPTGTWSRCFGGASAAPNAAPASKGEKGQRNTYRTRLKPASEFLGAVRVAASWLRTAERLSSCS